ncbi:MAG: helix-turn-helix transcriptional regulator [Candidatus Hydrothermarchaeota archaeon]
MKLKRPATENERLLASVLLIFIVYFGLNSLISILYGLEESAMFVQYKMTLSFVVSLIIGAVFFIWAKPEVRETKRDESLSILERALNDDEILLLDIIRNSEGITQDSLRFRTGFSKSKVSAIIINLEKKGIVSRERVGKTYKVYIGDWLKKE